MVVDVVLLAIGDSASCGTRAPVLACRDALRAEGAEVDVVVAHADTEIDAALKAVVQKTPASGGFASSAAAPAIPEARLVVASAADGQLRAVVRRLIRAYAPAPSKRPADLPPNRTMHDLPPLGVLPLGPDPDDLASRLGLRREPAAVASAVLRGETRRLDLLRTDSGSVTLDGALLGGVDEQGRAAGFRARVEVDDAVLSDGMELLLAAAVANADRYATFDGLPLVTRADCADGVVDVAVALPHAKRRLFGGTRAEVEVRRASGRAVAITPREEVPYLDDGVEATLTHKRSWWMEHDAWAVYV